MKTYYIYHIYTDEFIGTVEAFDIMNAEYKAAGKFTQYHSNEMYALSELC